MGVTVVDAGVLIGFLDRDDAHHASARTALEEAVDRGDRIVLPASALAEVLVGPSRRGQQAVDTVLDLIDRVPIDVEPLGIEAAVAGAALRGLHASIKLRDALVIATAQMMDPDRLVTTDRRWPSRDALGLRGAITEL